MTAPTLTVPKPILFAGPLAREVRADRKTQTRRLLKVQPRVVTPLTDGRDYEGDAPISVAYRKGGDASGVVAVADGEAWRRALGVHEPGTVLWVRETIALCLPGACFDEGGYTPGRPIEVVYLADGERHTLTPSPDWRVPGAAFKNNPVPSIHMPRWSALTFLRVTAVHLERLQSITDDDIRAEGLPGAFPLRRGETLREAWQRGWDGINGARHTEARPATWASNPWVVAYTFERVEPLRAGQRVRYVAAPGADDTGDHGDLFGFGGTALWVRWDMPGGEDVDEVDPFTGALLGYDCDIGRVEPHTVAPDDADPYPEGCDG